MLPDGPPPAQGGLTFSFEAVFVEDLPWLFLKLPGNLQLRRKSSNPFPTDLLSSQKKKKKTRGRKVKGQNAQHYM